MKSFIVMNYISSTLLPKCGSVENRRKQLSVGIKEHFTIKGGRWIRPFSGPQYFWKKIIYSESASNSEQNDVFDLLKKRLSFFLKIFHLYNPPGTSKNFLSQIFVKDTSFDSEFRADHEYRVESRKKINLDRKKLNL